MLFRDIEGQILLCKNIFIPMDKLPGDKINYVKLIDVHFETLQPIITFNDYSTLIYHSKLESWYFNFFKLSLNINLILNYR